MSKKIIKALELLFKKMLKRALIWALPKRSKTTPELKSLKKILVFRLDQRIGNGLLMIPLLRAIRLSRPDIELHFLIHHPVAKLLSKTTENLVNNFLPYNQPYLLKAPWRYLAWIKKLRQEKFDVIITCHNPDNFSLSQAIAGRLFRGKYLIGFDAKDSANFYDLAVNSSTEKHYSEAMLDLWRVFDPKAVCNFGGLKAPDKSTTVILEQMPQFKTGGILVWIGATGKKILPENLYAYLYKQLKKQTDLPVHFAAGPSDEKQLSLYPQWLRDKTTIWRNDLSETAAFFSLFSVFISPDTGPMHLAAALNLITLAIFKDSNMRQYSYHDGVRHFAIQWEDSLERRDLVDEYLKKILRIL